MSEIPLREPDRNLIPLLRKCNDDDLDTLVEYITEKGWLSSELCRTDVYETHSPHHSKYADEIAAEIQKYGGNTIANAVRFGKGVEYKEIVCDVADRLKVNYNKERSVGFIEEQICLKILEDAWPNMSNKEKKAFLEDISSKGQNSPIPKAFPLGLLQTAIRGGGLKAYQIGTIIITKVAKATAGYLGKVLPFRVFGPLVGKGMKGMKILAGPVGLALAGIWTAYDIAKPALRVTIPCVIHIAMLRRKYSEKFKPVTKKAKKKVRKKAKKVTKKSKKQQIVSIEN